MNGIEIPWPAVITTVAGGIISILVMIIPKVNLWYEALAAKQKQGVMVLTGLGVSVVTLALGYFNLLPIEVVFGKKLVWDILFAWAGFAFGNQTTYNYTGYLVTPKAVTAAKLAGGPGQPRAG